MEEEKKQRLEGKLRAIKDLKSKSYIGTKDAWEILDRVERILENPKIIAEKVNEGVSELTNITYPATPERVLGFNSIMWKLESYMPCAYEEIDEGLIDRISWFEKKVTGANFVSEYFYLDVDKAVEILHPYFLSANKGQIRSDKDFGDVVRDVISHKAVELKREGYGEYSQYADTFDNYMLNVSIFFDKSDVTTHLLSKDNSEKDHRKHLRNAESGVPLWYIIDRLVKDQVEHKFEYRRSIVVKFLEENSSGLKFLKENSCEVNYEDVMKWAKDLLKDYQKEAEEPKEYDKETASRMAKRYEYIVHVLASDKNFIKRFLSS